MLSAEGMYWVGQNVHLGYGKTQCPYWPAQYSGVNICDSWQQDKPGVSSDVHDSEVLAVSLLSSVQRSSHTYEHDLAKEAQ